jgi:hypothetical protein
MLVLGNELLKELHHLHRRILVERRGRLVGEQQPRPVDQRAGDGDALALPARQGTRHVVDALGEAEPRQHVDAALVHLGFPAGAELHRHLHVLVRGQRFE